MNIYAKKGTKVRYTGQGGYDGDRNQANQFLKVGGVYTVDSASISSWSTSVVLQEVGNQRFNSVHFEEVSSD